ncbi:MAG: shikimate kinase, partial [candidate division Zixibacteria bacterium]|nr:shikimate kinase [candidate division Zixibacteria bacterium]
DTLIVKREGKSITRIFADHGEQYFRKLEKKVLKEVLSLKQSQIIALGGGAFEAVSTRDLIRKHGVSVYLRCSLNEIHARVKNQTDRPLLIFLSKGKKLTRQEKLKRLKKLLDKRKINYARADISLSTTRKTVSLAVSELIERLKDAGNKR